MRQIKSEAGFTYYVTIFLMVALLICVMGAAEYVRLNMVTKGIRNALQSAMTTAATENWNEQHPSLREGYSGNNNLKNDTWTPDLDQGDIAGHLSKLLGIKESNNVFTKTNGKNVEYTFEIKDFQYKTGDFAPAEANPDKNTLWMQTKIKLTVPFDMVFRALPPLEVDLGAQAVYRPQF